jgi:hypothetical protein
MPPPDDAEDEKPFDRVNAVRLVEAMVTDRVGQPSSGHAEET